MGGSRIALTDGGEGPEGKEEVGGGKVQRGERGLGNEVGTILEPLE